MAVKSHSFRSEWNWSADFRAKHQMIRKIASREETSQHPSEMDPLNPP